MRRIRTIVMAVTMAVALSIIGVGTAFADTTTPTTTTAPVSEVRGTISAIDNTATSPTVSITPETGTAVTVKVTADTLITKEGLGKVTLDQITIGDRAAATYNKDTMVASKIEVSLPLAKHHSFVGVITSIAATNIVMTDKQKGDVTLSVNAQTKFNVPGLKTITLANFKVGDRVAVLAIEADGGNLALHINLIPGKPIAVHRVGEISAYTAGSTITLKDKKGELSTFAITGDTQINLKRGATEIKVGDQATVLARRDPSSTEYTAKEILVYAPIVKGPKTETPGATPNAKTTPTLPTQAKGNNK